MAKWPRNPEFLRLGRFKMNYKVTAHFGSLELNVSA